MPLVTIGSFRDIGDAHLTKIRLEASGIRAVVQDEYVVGIPLFAFFAFLHLLLDWIRGA